MQRARSWQDWTWEVIPPTHEPAHLQMALDEVLLRGLQRGERRPTLRFWGWAESALVLGSHQSVRNEVDQRAARRLGFTVARRFSGGGTMLVEPGRTITYSIYARAELVEGMTFVESFAFLDAWVVDALRKLGVDASHRPINDIVSPRGKIGGAAQARRRGVVLHHTTLAYEMDVEMLPRLIRIGRRRVTRRGLRSAEKRVSPLGTLVEASLADVVAALWEEFGRGRRVEEGGITRSERAEAERLVLDKYGTEAWIRRLP